MNATLSATHLLRQFLLYAVVVVFLLLMIRAGYALWFFPTIEASGKPLQLFLTGLRFDLSLVGILCLVPVVLCSLLAMFEATRVLAKWLMLVWFPLSLGFVLATELITPYFIASEGMRPDAATFTDLPALAATLGTLVIRHPVLVAIGTLLLLLILVAYIARMESTRLLRYRLSRPSALALALLGGVVCVLAARSALDVTGPVLSVADARLGGEPVIDQIAMNSAWTTLRSWIAP